MILAHIEQNPPIHYLNKLEYFIRPINIFLVNCWPSGKYVLLTCICTQYMIGAPFALITASIRRGMEVISVWHCWGGMEARFLWQWPSAHLHFLGLLFLIFLLKILLDSLCGSDLGSLPVGTCIIYYVTTKETLKLAGQSSTPTPRSFNQLLVLLAVVGRCPPCEFHKSKCIICKLTSNWLQLYHFVSTRCLYSPYVTILSS